MVKYELKKEVFINWHFEDMDDQLYWANRIKKSLLNKGKVNLSVQEIFEERDYIPVYLLEGDVDAIEEAEGNVDIDPKKVVLID